MSHDVSADQLASELKLMADAANRLGGRLVTGKPVTDADRAEMGSMLRELADHCDGGQP